jgi:hypothetical protein
MPENIGSVGAPYNTKIPRIVENADIQTALRLYHYGSDTKAPATIEAASIAGHLNALENKKIDKTPETIPGSINLDNYTTTGFYVQPSVTNARSGTRYPAINGVFFPGMLRVVRSGAIIFQEYHLIGEIGNIINTVYWRVLYLGTWSEWKASIEKDEFLKELDERYFIRSLVYDKAVSDDTFSPKLFAETAPQTANYTPLLADINKVVVMDVPTGGTLFVPTNATRAFQIGSVLNVYNISTNLLTIAPENSNVIVRNAGRLERFKEASIRKRAVDEWVAAGPLY